MAADKSDEKKFTEYLDKIIAGEEISIDEPISDELRAAIEFASRLYADQETPSADFRNRLWNRLQYKINSRQTAPEAEGFIASISRIFSPRSPAWIIATGVAAAILVIIVGVVWYSIGYSAQPSTTSLAELPPREYTIDLPSNISPEPLVIYLNTPLSSKTEQAPVYQVEQMDITNDFVAALGAKLGFSREPVSSEDGSQIVMIDDIGDEARKLTVWAKSGAIEYGYTNPEKLYPLYTPDLPQPDEAKKLAYDFLEKLDLLPTTYTSFADIQNKIVVEAGGGYDIYDSDTGEVIQKDPSFWLINFPFYIDDKTATGPGAKIEVSIGEKGEPVNLVWAWRETKSVYSGKIKSEENAFEDILNNKGSLELPLSCDNAMVNKVTLSYWINPLSEEQDYVLPVYEFKGDCFDNNGQFLESFTAWTEALLPAY